MGFEILDGSVRIHGSYGVKVNRGNYQTEDMTLGMSIEFSLEDSADFDVATAKAMELDAALATQVKLATFAQLGLDFTEIKDGVVVAKLPVVEDNKPKARGGRQNKSGGGRGSGQGGIDRSESPTYTFEDSDGDKIEVYDERPLKDKGLIKETAADFRAIKGRRSFWLYNAEGDPNNWVFEMAEAAGVSDLPD